ncbi:MAG: alpha/beta hydrolase [Pigmentiphaga sp.]
MTTTLKTLLQQTSALGSNLDDTVLSESERLWTGASRHVPDSLRCVEDVPYGPHARHRLDVFSSSTSQRVPVLMYVHGGGFTGGDKQKADSAFYQNIGSWAVGQGMVAVNMTYRLAPEAQWPAVVEDISEAMRWIYANIEKHGGDPGAVVIMGHSAGAAHAADFVAQLAEKPELQKMTRGAVLLSGLYEIVSAGARPSVRAYYGDDAELQAVRSSQGRLAASGIPLFLGVAQYEPPLFQEQALKLAMATLHQRGAMPMFHTAQDHNHFSEVYHFGSEDQRLSATVAAFIRQVCSASAEA